MQIRGRIYIAKYPRIVDCNWSYHVNGQEQTRALVSLQRQQML